MEEIYFWLLTLVTAVCLGVIAWKTWEGKKATAATTPTNSGSNNVPTQHDLMETTLKKLGCQPQWSTDDKDMVQVTYQGEHFSIDVENGRNFIMITDAWWHQASLDDIDQFSLIRQAINECNLSFPSATVLYTINKEDNNIGVHTRQTVLFIREIPNLDDYLRSRFESSFVQHRNFFHKMEELRGQHHT